ncbi:leucine-rich repeat extensin-like protein 3 [Neltuma alba]|uniref:leucine-rich repeat extensin-like protein 3 n=1 Tax=Neltuma alba TaxID=207710 RepID=UPI0010A55125|nr:leucine-rich repeat extensin-like protein 3 [Prosopis alba]
MTSSIIHVRHLEVTVRGCNLFQELYPRSQPLYVCFQYGDLTCITVPSQDGGMNTSYPNRAGFPLIEGLNELKFVVWKTIQTNFDYNDFMGSGRICLHSVVSEGSKESSYDFQKENNRYGELELALQCRPSEGSDPSSSLANSTPLSHPRHPYHSSHNFSTDRTLSYWPPPVFHHSLSYPPPPPPPRYPPTYPSLPQPYQYSLPYPPPPSHYLPQYLFPPSHHLPLYPVQPPPLRPPIHPVTFVASFLSIGENLFQFFCGN